VAERRIGSRRYGAATPSQQCLKPTEPWRHKPADKIAEQLAESFNGLYKTEMIRKRGPWRGLDDVEYAMNPGRFSVHSRNSGPQAAPPVAVVSKKGDPGW